MQTRLGLVADDFWMAITFLLLFLIIAFLVKKYTK